MSISETKRRLALAAGFLVVACLVACGPSDGKSGGKRSEAVPAAAAPAAPAASPAAPAAARAEPAAAPAIGAKTLEGPDDLQMVMLAYHLTGREPPLEDWAADTDAVRGADEFSRDAKLKREEARLRSIYDGVAGVGTLVLDVDSAFSEYDSTRGGYYIQAFSPGQSFTFRAHDTVGLQITNLLQAQFWAVAPDRAKAILEKSRHSRSLRIQVTIAITGTQNRSSGVEIEGRLTRYVLYLVDYSGRDQEQLADVTL